LPKLSRGSQFLLKFSQKKRRWQKTVNDVTENFFVMFNFAQKILSSRFFCREDEEKKFNLQSRLKFKNRIVLKPEKLVICFFCSALETFSHNSVTVANGYLVFSPGAGWGLQGCQIFLDTVYQNGGKCTK
jgi:hypothetical protein